MLATRQQIKLAAVRASYSPNCHDHGNNLVSSRSCTYETIQFARFSAKTHMLRENPDHVELCGEGYCDYETMDFEILVTHLWLRGNAGENASGLS